MTICIFLGPTLPLSEAQCLLDAKYLPPVTAGDVYRAARKRPHAIVIIDGFFERVPAVWHKEILWAMAQGIHVFGCSSMGALRAAELASFGMQGSGKVFDAFANGAIEDDDEVAVAHSPKEDGYRALSDAMVNIRATLAAAEHGGVLSSGARAALQALAKSMFYPERKLEVLARLGVSRGLLTPDETLRFEAWLPQGRVDQKRADAVELLRKLAAVEGALESKLRVHFQFEHTHTWEELLREVGSAPESSDDPELDEFDRAVLDELRLKGSFASARRAGIGRALAIEEVTRLGWRPSAVEVRSTSESLRRERGLLDVEAFRGWLRDNRLDMRSLESFVSDEAGVRWLERALEPAGELHILDHLRLSGEYGQLLESVRARAACLRDRGHDPSAPRLPLGVEPRQLWQWYFENRLRRPVPESLVSYAETLGFKDKAALEAAVLRMFLSEGLN